MRWPRPPACWRSHAALRGFERPRPDRSLWHPALWPGDSDPEPLRDRALDRFEAAFAEDARFVETSSTATSGRTT